MDGAAPVYSLSAFATVPLSLHPLLSRICLKIHTNIAQDMYKLFPDLNSNFACKMPQSFASSFGPSGFKRFSSTVSPLSKVTEAIQSQPIELEKDNCQSPSTRNITKHEVALNSTGALRIATIISKWKTDSESLRAWWRITLCFPGPTGEIVIDAEERLSEYDPACELQKTFITEYWSSAVRFSQVSSTSSYLVRVDADTDLYKPVQTSIDARETSAKPCGPCA
ncbi:hypothetical protein F5878DRAFT_694714 [Lentinula raphanica]|uniref:Uncharacterized protein n=1 Tax=Lentinula raphanica TaxID=153919 RepID=A0AA38PHH5_9AGAR|nr:hypothetical protein F5878DRAFT_694714 [Lentinula raphanica]